MDKKVKSVLFVIDSLRIGGAEKSLVTLLNLFDYEKYQVDLMLFARGGEFEELLPKQVHVVEVPEMFKYSQIPWSSLKTKFKSPLKMFVQLKYSFGIRATRSDSVNQAVLLWKSYGRCIQELEKKYDCAIAYGQGAPTFYVADKVYAKRKIAWVNAVYLPEDGYLKYIDKIYHKYDKVVGVSDNIKKLLLETFGIPKSNVTVIKDIIDASFAKRMARWSSTVLTDMSNGKNKILTVGRLADKKGQDLAIRAAGLLKNANVDFVWYFVGDGETKNLLSKMILELHLENNVVLLGGRSNPYPYFENCDIYVQPSRSEGFGISLAEAKLFGKPVVATKFNSVNEQIQNEVNGLIVDMSPKGIMNGVITLLTQNSLREKCVANALSEEIENKNEIDKVYDIIN